MLAGTGQSGAILFKGAEPVDLICEGVFILFSNINVIMVFVAMEIKQREGVVPLDFQANPP